MAPVHARWVGPSLTVIVFQIEELYSEVLYLLIHNVGSDVASAVDREALCRLLQDAFKIDEEKHQQLLSTVEAKEVGDSLLTCIVQCS